MNEFINWGTLATYGGALAMVLVLTQFTKELAFVKKFPTQIWSYILALIVLLPALAFTGQLSLNTLFQSLFNAVIISIAANGAHAGVKKILGSDTVGTLHVDTSNPNKDTYRIDLGENLDKLDTKNKITVAVKKTNLTSTKL